ncbi:MAG TPA: hypothetical protein VNN08_11340, partial [Thermoanaerobaculia bacterium]|nr:hypothetical protein [Thermoanaerobaculia bacterium]
GLAFLSTTLYAAKSVPDGPLPPPDDYTVLAGKVWIGTIDAHTIGVVVNDGRAYRHLFRLWTEASVKPFQVTSQSASIEYRGDELVVMAADGDFFYALVTASGAAHAPRQPAGINGVRYVGYGLNHEIRPVEGQTGGTRLHIRALDSCDDGSCLFNLDYGVGGSGTGCSSGGSGSTSCSISNTYGSCSVTCSSGYACCVAATSTNNASCTCK